MQAFDRIAANHEIGVGISPQKADLAIVSVDSYGTPGLLNEFVLKEYRYSADKLPRQKDLSRGFAAIAATKDKKAILFVVTVSGDASTSENLDRNLYYALIEFQKWYKNKTVWIPLMGTGSGGLDLAESYLITARTINQVLKEFPTDVKFMVSLPDDKSGDELLNNLQSNNVNPYKEDKKFLSSDNKASTIPVNNKIALLLSDAETGEDYLDISKDVTAFARVIAATSFIPPLAIALLGKWGSGKSFFMRKLREQIVSFSEMKGSEIYCKGVAHIHFNAWSYMDANLWASIVSKIFEGLNEYISKRSLSDDAKKKIEEELSSQLLVTQEKIGDLKTKKNAVEEQIETLKRKREHLNNKLSSKIWNVKSNTLWEAIKNVDKQFDARKKIIEAFKANPTYFQTEDELKRIIPEEYWSDPEGTYQQIKSKYTFLKEFFRSGRLRRNLCWLFAFLLVICIIPFLLHLMSAHINGADLLIPQGLLMALATGGVIWRRARIVYNKLEPLVASFWRIKENYEKQIRKVTNKFKQEEKALKLEIEKSKSEIATVEEQIQKAETVKADIEFKINHALATESLYSFIDKRSKSDDYRKHLGIISTIRKDFETLNGLFTDHHGEIDKATEELKAEFKSKFAQPLERVVLYIDDLDRCSEENVVQVLEAVNLLMAFPLFVVIVGVDPRWVKNALIKKHAGQFVGYPNGHTGNGLEVIDPSNYLEKIFQVPFHLKEAKDTNVKAMIKELANRNRLPPQKIGSPEISGDISRVPEKNGEPDEQVAENSITVTDRLVISEDSAFIAELPELLILTDTEVAVMQDMSEIVGNNPRAVKRFVNIFRIVKAHGELNYENGSADTELPAILFLLALSLGGYGKLLPSFEAYIREERNIDKPVTQYLQLVHETAEVNTLKQTLNVVLSDKLSFSVIQRTPSSIFLKYITFIKRFAFEHI